MTVLIFFFKSFVSTKSLPFLLKKLNAKLLYNSSVRIKLTAKENLVDLVFTCQTDGEKCCYSYSELVEVKGSKS